MTAKEFIKHFHVTTNENKAILYKYVYKVDGEYFSYYDQNFKYRIGEVITEECDTDVVLCCTKGIHIASKKWVLNVLTADISYFKYPITILEVEVDIDKIVVPLGTTGKVRTSEVKVLRELPIEELGLCGKAYQMHRLYL